MKNSPINLPSIVEETLVIIDMQPFFLKRAIERNGEKFRKTWNKIVAAIKKEIAQAISKSMPILVVEYKHSFFKLGKTTKSITKHLEQYPNTFIVKKSQDDGSEAIRCFLEKSPCKSVGTFRVTGVNRSACISYTVQCLASDFEESTIVLVDDAIGDELKQKYLPSAIDNPNVQIEY